MSTPFRFLMCALRTDIGDEWFGVAVQKYVQLNVNAFLWPFTTRIGRERPFFAAHGYEGESCTGGFVDYDEDTPLNLNKGTLVRLITLKT